MINNFIELLKNPEQINPLLTIFILLLGGLINIIIVISYKFITKYDDMYYISDKFGYIIENELHPGHILFVSRSWIFTIIVTPLILLSVFIGIIKLIFELIKHYKNKKNKDNNSILITKTYLK